MSDPRYLPAGITDPQSTSDWRKEYAEQLAKGMQAMSERLFPDDFMAVFESAAQGDIEAGRNVCAMHSDRTTMRRLYPDGAWICGQCAQVMFKAGMLNGRVVFDMTKPATEDK